MPWQQTLLDDASASALARQAASTLRSPAVVHVRIRSSEGSLLPKGGTYDDRPPGRRQFRLASLLWLLTIGAVVLAIGRSIGCDPSSLFVLLALTVILWWQYAEIREPPLPPLPPRPKGAEELREEIERWKAQRP